MNEPWMQNIPADLAELRLMGDLVLVRRLMDPEETPTGLFLPPSVANPRTGNRRGLVIKVGPGDRLKDGSRGCMCVQPGDEIVYARVPANDIRIDGEEYTLLHEEQHVLCIVDRAVPVAMLHAEDRRQLGGQDREEEALAA